MAMAMLGQHRALLLHRGGRVNWQRGMRCSASPGKARATAAGDEERKWHVGSFGRWQVTEGDQREVAFYRGALSMSAACLAMGASAATLGVLPQGVIGPLYYAGALSLGVATFLIHIYVDEIKKVIQALWAIGMGSSLIVAFVHGSDAAHYAFEHPAAVWGIGPLFAALTGIAFKEGLCYGKLEALGLFFALPATLLGHMVGLGPGVKSILLWAIVALFCLFAAGKWRQPVAEDIGDKSVFWFNSLGDEEQEQWMERLKTSDPSNPPAID